MTFNTLKINYNLYIEKILPYIKENSEMDPSNISGSNLYPLKEGLVQVDSDLEDLKSEKMIISINPNIRNNKKIIKDLEELTGEKFD